jgi:hypothetical protein
MFTRLSRRYLAGLYVFVSPEVFLLEAKARSTGRSCVRQNPETLQTMTNLGYTLAEQGHLPEAEALLRSDRSPRATRPWLIL